MKRTLKTSVLLPIFLFVMLYATNTYGQLPTTPEADPSLGGTNGAVGHPLNGGANIDGGMNIFLLFALAYGTHRYYRAKRKEKELADNAIE